MKRIAIVGSGISSLASAYYLKKAGHHITLFEANSYFGGHSNTIDIDIDGKTIPVDTGFLVHNDRTYPNLIKLFKELNIPIAKSDMSLSVQALNDNIEWSGTSLATLFSQKKNLISPKFWRMVIDILRFNKNAHRYLNECKLEPEMTLGELLKKENYSKSFINWYFIPMGAAIWSTPAQEIFNYTAFTFIQFCINHGLLQVFDRPQWKTIIGGSRVYVKKITDMLDKTYLNTPVLSIRRSKESTEIKIKGETQKFDLVISGLHAPDIKKIISDLTDKENKVLGAFKYQTNQAVLHSDESFLPQNKKAWASWNYTTLHSNSVQDDNPVSVHYYINMLQPLDTQKPIIVTLNPHKNVNSQKKYKEIIYRHPLFNKETTIAQRQIIDIQGINGLYYTGAWQRYGFHEDGILSAIKVIELLKAKGEI